MCVTAIPRSAVAVRSIDALEGPVDAINFSFGRRFSSEAVNGVRSLMTQITSNGTKRSARAS